MVFFQVFKQVVNKFSATFSNTFQTTFKLSELSKLSTSSTTQTFGPTNNTHTTLSKLFVENPGLLLRSETILKVFDQTKLISQKPHKQKTTLTEQYNKFAQIQTNSKHIPPSTINNKNTHTTQSRYWRTLRRSCGKIGT